MEVSFHGLVIETSDDVYPPSDDSFMLAKGAQSLRGKVLEIGCGSGIASLSCAASAPANQVLGIDINPSAVECAKGNARRNGIRNAGFLQSDLFRDVPALEYDAIMLNPPYLPTSEDERLSGDINLAYDGGPDGRMVLERFLGDFDRYLRPGGTLLLIQSSLNGREKTLSILSGMGYSAVIDLEEAFFFEKLCLIDARKALTPHL